MCGSEATCGQRQGGEADGERRKRVEEETKVGETKAGEPQRVREALRCSGGWVGWGEEGSWKVVVRAGYVRPR